MSSQFPMPEPTRRGGGRRIPPVGGFNVSRLNLPSIDIQGLLDNWSSYAFGGDGEEGMFDIARRIAADEANRKKRGFDLYEEAKTTDIAAAQQAMELQRINDQRARQRELQARMDAQTARSEATQRERAEDLAQQTKASEMMNRYDPFGKLYYSGAGMTMPSPWTEQYRMSRGG